MPPLTRKFYFFIGTEAELIKLFPVLREFQVRRVPFTVIASGQNNIQQSQLLKILKIKKIDIVLHDDSIHQSVFGLFSWFLKTLLFATLKLRSDLAADRHLEKIMIVHGDTVSSVMGAIIGKLYGCTVVHLEAGLRSFNFLHPFPEEIDRVLVSRMATLHFCPNKWSVNNLKRRRGKKINTFQNTLLDSLNLAVKQKVPSPLLKKLARRKYFVFVCHRQENLLNPTIIEFLLGEVIQFSKKITCVFILHELTRVTLEKKQLLHMVEKQPSIITTPRLPYVEMMQLLEGAECLITDGGSNQEEAYYLGKPCLLLRQNTERIEGLNQNVVLSKNELQVIHDFMKNYKKYNRPKVRSKVSPSKIIVDNLVKG